MNVLLLDDKNCFLDFALRCMSYGHYVRVCNAYVHGQTDKRLRVPTKVGDGLVEKIPNEDWQKHAKWADLILLADNTRWLPELDALKKKGYPVFAPSVESARLEHERGLGQALMKKCGLNVMPYEMFTDYHKAEEYVLATNERYVSKPDGDVDKALSYVSKSPADMVFMLRRWNHTQNKGRRFMLQGFVPGVEFAVNGWMGKRGFSKWIEESFEHKKLMNDDYGPNTGEMGTAIRYVDHSALAEEVLLPLERELMKMGHTGSVDVSVIVDEDGNPRPLEFTIRLGWPAFNICQPLHPEPCDWMVDLLDGNDSFKPSTQHAVGVVMAIPDFPYSHHTLKETAGVPIYGLDNENEWRNQISPCELMLGECPAMVDGEVCDKKLMVSVGDYLCVATGLGDTVSKAKDQAYEVVKSMEVPNNLIVRTDIGDIEEELEVLQGHGFAKEWVF